jgi:hypothetical protein
LLVEINLVFGSPEEPLPPLGSGCTEGAEKTTREKNEIRRSGLRCDGIAVAMQKEKGL